MRNREGEAAKDPRGKEKRGAGPGNERGDGKSGESGGEAGEREASKARKRGATVKEGEAWA